MPLAVNVAGLYGPYAVSGAPVAGANEVQTLTSTATGGSFKILIGSELSGDIAWNSTAGSAEAILNAMRVVGAGGGAVVGCAVTGGPLNTVALTVTFSGTNVAQVPMPLMVVAYSTLTGGTVTPARTTTGVPATGRGAPPGAIMIREDAGNVSLLQNTGTAAAPVWTAR